MAFYRNLYDSVKGLVTVVNLAQILGLFSAFLFILVLTFTDEKWQLWIQLAHFAVLLVTSVLAARAYGMIGFAWASLGANSLRVAAVIILGLVKAKPEKIKEAAMQTGEVLRRVVFDLLDAAKGGRLKKLKEVNKREIVEGVTEEYMDRRIHVLLDYVKNTLLIIKIIRNGQNLRFSGNDQR